ncbi:hypothetical protein N779_09820 [Vibrio coralliilyticus OCN008]|nr:hypothetical protein N779_09820 [Vibrio coralliilyticus OCN008]
MSLNVLIISKKNNSTATIVIFLSQKELSVFDATNPFIIESLAPYK